MEKLSDPHIEAAMAAAQSLERVARKLPILKSVAWGANVKQDFLERGRLPKPEYRQIDFASISDNLGAISVPEGDHSVFEWLARIRANLTNTLLMLSARGSEDFYIYSKALFGSSTDVMLDGKTRVIDLASHMDRIFEAMSISKLVLGEGDETFSAQHFASKLTPPLRDYFGRNIPEIQIVEDMPSRAVAGSRRIRLRQGALFTDRDVDQLLQHEAFIHAGTAKNGRLQDAFPILGRAHAGTTEIQEGLAVFAEMISGSMDPMRFRRLSDRVFAINMAEQGADFKEVFDYYLERNLGDMDAAYNNTYRVFRGGVISGGAPFTKDLVYLKGLLRVHNYLRTVVSLERSDLIRLLFVGKLDVEDIPAIAYLRKEGLILAPKYVPPWIKDLRFLVSYLAYSAFLNQVKLPGFKRYYSDALADVPNIWAAEL